MEREKFKGTEGGGGGEGGRGKGEERKREEREREMCTFVCLYSTLHVCVLVVA